jgi:hypothetical protein
MKEKSPAFQFYPKDFLSDAKVIMMSREARGAYITLLCIDWLEDGFRKDLLPQYAGITNDGSAIAQLCECFIAHPSKDGYVTNPRLQKERKKQEDYSKERSGSGKRGAKARWNRELAPMAQPSESHRLSHGSAIKEPMAKNGSSSSSSSPSSNKKNIYIYTLPDSAPFTLQAALQAWQSLQREKHNRQISQVEVDAMLMQWAPRFKELEAALIYSTANGWKNIREKVTEPSTTPAPRNGHQYKSPQELKDEAVRALHAKYKAEEEAANAKI